MENFYINFTIGSEITYPKDLLKVISQNYEYDLSQKNLNNIFMLMTSLDGSLSRKVKRGEKCDTICQNKETWISKQTDTKIIDPRKFRNMVVS